MTIFSAILCKKTDKSAKKSDPHLYTKKQAVIACLSNFLLKFLISNVLFPYNYQKLDISLYPLFYDIIKINKLNASKSEGFELTETQSVQQKRASKKALDLNGGKNASYIEPFINTFKEQLLSKSSTKLIYMLNQGATKYAA